MLSFFDGKKTNVYLITPEAPGRTPIQLQREISLAEFFLKIRFQRGIS